MTCRGNMGTVESIKRILKSHKREIQKRYNVKEIGIFGSYVRGEQKSKSDIDILVDFFEAPDLIEFIELRTYLSRLLKAEVDLVMKSALKPGIGRKILNEVIYL